MKIPKQLLTKRNSFWYITVFVCFQSIISCVNPQKKETFTIAFSQCIGSDAWRETMLIEMKRELSFHSNVKLLYTDAQGNNENQIRQVKEILKSDIDLLIISPNEAAPLTQIVDEVFQKGIPVVVTDRKTSSGLYNAYVGADNYDTGYLAGTYLAQKLKGSGRITEITGLSGSSASIERQDGFHKALDDYPEIKLSKPINGQWLIDTARKEVLKNSAIMRETDALFAFNDQMALGSYQALKTMELPQAIKIIGVDALPGKNNGLEQIAAGTLEASILYPTGGKEAIRTALAILNKQPYHRENILQTMVIDSTNVQLMQMQADKINNQQEDIDKQLDLLAEQKAIYRNQQTVLNILVISLVLAIVLGGISFYLLKANWEKNKRLENQNKAIINQQKELISLNEIVKEATDAKFNFFTTISHEFKTPLTLILSPVEELLSGSKISPEVKSQLQLVRKNSLRLMRLVTQLIDLRRLGYEKLKLKVHQQNMLHFINSIIASFKPLLLQRNISIEIENNSKNQLIWMDSNLMEKVFYNLFSNALKFSNNSGHIVVSLKNNQTDNLLEVSVKDNGKGINKSHIEHIFNPFYRGECNTEGSGIGLALVKDIIELHHGTIHVTSQENAGSCFTFHIPLGDAHFNDQEKIIEPYEQRMDSLVYMDQSKIDLYPQKSSRETFLSPSLKDNSVLLVDDNEDILYFLNQNLAEHYTIYTATNVEDALTIVHKQVPDLIISDIVMPNKSGIELLTLIKNDNRSSHIPIVLLSARESTEQKTKGLEALADMYITKPFSISHVKAAIENLITNRRNLRLKYSSLLETHLHTPKHLDSDRRFLNELSAIVETNLANSSFGVEDICKPLGVSRIQLYRRVKGLLNSSVNDYINDRRLKKAKFLLQQDKIINEVANETGFASSTYFSTAFKKKYGISPSAFKNSSQKEKC